MFRVILFFSCFLFIQDLFGQDEYMSLKTASEYSNQKKYEKADSILLALLAKSPNDIPLKIARAYNQSWWGNFANAKILFNEVLKVDQKNIDAYIGLGNNYSYNGEYANSYNAFNAALKIDNNCFEAKKGLAYKYYFEGNLQMAEKHFNELIKLRPKEEEFTISLANVYLAQNRINASEKLADAILKNNPNSHEAKVLTGQNRRALSDLEITTWASSTMMDNNTTFGLRLLQVNMHYKEKYNFGVRLDNSLSTDNLSLYGQSVFSPTVWLTSGFKLSKPSYGILDIGNRFLNGNTMLLKGEYIYFTKSNIVIKSGFYTDLSADVEEYNIRLGMEGPLAKWLRIGGTYFIAKESSNAVSTYRWLGNAKFILTKGSSIDVGYFFGNSGISEQKRKMINGGFSILQVPISKRFSALGLVSYENGIFAKSTIIGLGLRTKLFSKKQ